MITETFGPNAMLDVVVGAQSECDSQGVRLLARYLEAKRVPRLAQEVQSSKRSSGTGQQGQTQEPRLDPR